MTLLIIFSQFLFSKIKIEFINVFQKQFKIFRYNDEWMIVDYNMFTPGMPLKNGLLTVLDQIPGTVTWNDQTNILRAQAYFASYNIP
jgi:hypothetical protein